MGEASLWGLALGPACPESSEAVWGWAVYPLVMLYAFYILAQICDGHLTTALEWIVRRIKLSEDVAGATFLAMASSAPELFTSIIATCVLESSSGVGNILGSAVFNLLVIIGVVPVFAGSTLKIWWYPTARDAIFYMIAILEVFLVMLDGAVYWWEGLIMTVSYFLYAGYFTQNERIIKKLGLTPPNERKEVQEPGGKKAGGEKDPAARTGDTGGTESEVSNEEVTEARVDKRSESHQASEHSKESVTEAKKADGDIRKSGRNSSSRNSFQLKGKAKAAAKSCKVYPETAAGGEGGQSGASGSSGEPYQEVDTAQLAAVVPAAAGSGGEEVKAVSEDPGEEEEEEDDEGRTWCRYEPVMMLVDATMPASPEWLYTLFGLCCIWIGIFTYFAVDASSRLGCLLDLDDEVMGLVVLAAGTSVPDAMGSIAVAKDGMGDMAVANAVGSNTFDILLGLGFPWFIWAAFTGEPIIFNTKHLNFAIAILSTCLVGYLAIIIANRWMLTKNLGFLLLFAYGVVIFLILMRYYGEI